MGAYALTVEKLIEEFRKMPGIGSKSAQRLAFYVLGLEKEAAKKLTDAIIEAKEKITYCPICQNLTDTIPCHICSDEKRDKTTICVVESSTDVATLERLGDFKGTYHVLHGVISPMEGIMPDDIRLKELLPRIKDGSVKEVIVATNTGMEGETTAAYISKMLNAFGIKVTRIAKGIPVGSEIEYADDITLQNALQNRVEI